MAQYLPHISQYLVQMFIPRKDHGMSVYPEYTNETRDPGNLRVSRRGLLRRGAVLAGGATSLAIFGGLPRAAPTSAAGLSDSPTRVRAAAAQMGVPDPQMQAVLDQLMMLGV